MKVSFDNIKDEYERNWSNMRIGQPRADAATEAARKAINHKEIYKEIETKTDVPWWFVAVLHSRESSFNFNTYLGNGQALNRVTTIVPKGRGPFASFAEGAVDALRLEGFVGARDWGIAKTMFRLEKYNGFGYRGRGVNSPYLWSGSNIYGPPEQRGGKFTSDGAFEPGTVDPQLGAAVILKAMMELDASITFGGAPAMLSHLEPEEQLASMALSMQQCLNKLGANPPLDEDGIVGPKTKAAVAQFQQQHGITESGVLDTVTVAAITRAAQLPAIGGQTGDLSNILKRLEDLAQIVRGGARQGAPPEIIPPAANDPISLFERLFSLVSNKTATPMPGPLTPNNPAPVDQLKQVVDLLSTLLNGKDGKPVLGQVNGALGETIGKLLDGKKTALGIFGSVITALLSSVTASPNAGGIAGLLGTIVSAVPGLGQFAMPISLALAAWGVLGKLEKWAQGTAPPPKVTT
ncbi:peptidoglycan-binding protein [Bradyrhizobium diazoefficiens]|uniref:peptidoglycan-binding protein n=1 Tax=Bradyrhizobium diazoefficiens TaxID=1355477 RepID=UPI00190CC72E|nr:peptidoglycan-binding protein [Bradyrhizobium diazoefficiens]QQO14382.1 peptidoglycan-binding protein [Bradyrhizobium diazoefficiens]